MKLTMFTEAISRYGGEDTMLPPDGVPSDGVSRILMSFRAQPIVLRNRTPEDWIRNVDVDPHCERQRLIMDAMDRALGRPASYWVIGEERSLPARALATVHGSRLRRIQWDAVRDLIVWHVDMDAPETRRFLPAFVNPRGTRLFGFSREATKFEARLANVYEHMKDDPSMARAEWNEMWNQCDTRRGVKDVCLDADICVLPDGMHCQLSSVQSSELCVDELVAALRFSATERGVECATIRNTGDEWKMLLPRSFVVSKRLQAIRDAKQDAGQ